MYGARQACPEGATGLSPGVSTLGTTRRETRPEAEGAQIEGTNKVAVQPNGSMSHLRTPFCATMGARIIC
jgi:hypothetical protein